MRTILLSYVGYALNLDRAIGVTWAIVVREGLWLLACAYVLWQLRRQGRVSKAAARTITVLAFLTGTGYINVRIVSFLIKLFAMRLLIRLMAPEPWDLRPEDRELFIGQSMMTTVGWSLTAFIASLFTVFGYRPRPEMQQGRRLAPMTLPIMLAPLFLIPLEPYITQGLTTLADLL